MSKKGKENRLLGEKKGNERKGMWKTERWLGRIFWLGRDFILDIPFLSFPFLSFLTPL
jgi:hypothetical protein